MAVSKSTALKLHEINRLLAGCHSVLRFLLVFIKSENFMGETRTQCERHKMKIKIDSVKKLKLSVIQPKNINTSVTFPLTQQGGVSEDAA
jgi:hypothetical protein